MALRCARESLYSVWPAFDSAPRRVSFVVFAARGWCAVMAKRKTEMWAMEFDVAIVGSGLAGLSVALNLAQTRRVAVIAKRSMTEGARDWAQGGIAAVL